MANNKMRSLDGRRSVTPQMGGHDDLNSMKQQKLIGNAFLK